jgi:8-oxo-dGTP pyrophosphatase MutT (NUDIX family)
MVTTAVVAEIVVAGLEALAWISLVVLAVFGVDWLDPSELEHWVALVTLLVLATAYVLGVLTDRAADSLMLWLGDTLGARPVDKPAEIERMRLELMSEETAAFKFLDYQRTRMRVARATVFNLFALVPALTAFLIAQTTAGRGVVIGAALVAAFAGVLAYVACRRIEFAYLQGLSEAYRIANSLPDTDIAGAICYRLSRRGVEFCIVRTKDREHWTFPKGHREGSETLPEAAAREAEEEAGVQGVINGRRLDTFRYPASRPGLSDDDLVAAFPLEFKETGVLREPWREPSWLGPDATKARLAERREPEYVAEFERLLNKAIRAVERS